MNGSAEVLSHLPTLLTETLLGIVVISVVGVIFLIIAVKMFPKAKENKVQFVLATDEESGKIVAFFLEVCYIK